MSPLPASVGEERIIGFPLSVNALAPLLKEMLLNRVPAGKLLVADVCVPPVKISRSFVAGVTPLQFPGVVQLPSGTAPPFQVSVAADAL